tara:strand:+ start:1906 stop:2247 length:342 start_codon:yes stop_codon:yes gene_type:complete
MSTFLKKENLTISTGEYQKDGQTKKEWRTIGELITMQGDDGQPYQFFKMWGAGGVVEGKVFEQQDRNQTAQQPQQPTQQQQPQQGFQQQYQQQGQQQQPQQQAPQGNFNNGQQ